MVYLSSVMAVSNCLISVLLTIIVEAIQMLPLELQKLTALIIKYEALSFNGD